MSEVAPKTAGLEDEARKFLKSIQRGGAENIESIWNMAQVSLFNFEISL